MLEAKIEKEVTLYAREMGWLSFKFTSPGNRSVPDRMYLRNGKVIFIEFKQYGKKPTKLQKFTHRLFKGQEFEVQIIDSIEAGLEFFNEQK